MPRKLTPKEEKFVGEMLVRGNATRAYLAAFGPGVGYRTAATQAARLLKKPDIAAELSAARADLRRRSKVSARRVVAGLAAVAFADIGDLFDLTSEEWKLLPPRAIPYEARRAVASLKVRRRDLRDRDGNPAGVEEVVEVKLCDKGAALDKLMRHLGLYKDLPPLEVLLAALPREVSEHLRKAMDQADAAGDVPPPDYYRPTAGVPRSIA